MQVVQPRQRVLHCAIYTYTIAKHDTDVVDDIPELVSLASNVDLSETDAFIQVQLCASTCCLICDTRSGALVQRRNFQGCGGSHC
jgi:hypothetical protein